MASLSVLFDWGFHTVKIGHTKATSINSKHLKVLHHANPFFDITFFFSENVTLWSVCNLLRKEKTLLLLLLYLLTVIGQNTGP